jgi:hypothetical protein
MENFTLIGNIISEHLDPKDEKRLKTFIEPYLVVINSDEAILLALDEDEVASNLHVIMKELSEYIAALYNFEGAITTVCEFTYAPAIARVSKYDTLILKVIYESEIRIYPEQIVDSFASKSPTELKPRKNSLLQKLFRSYNQVLSSGGYVSHLIEQSGKTIPNQKSLIRSIIPLSFLDLSSYFNPTPKIQTPYQPHFYKC